MQDIHSFETSGGGGGRLFAGGGDRRLRHHHHHQDLNCPRCDSSNTKFCYYNNYNLSQPRHFCKSCRRYWTKGGVLRNVPVGGGIRKAKRSNKPKPKTTIPASDAVAVAVATERKPSNAENSSSDSSTPNTTATTTTTDVSGSNSTNSTPATMINFNESSRRFFNIPQSSTPIITTFDPVTVNQNQSSAGNTLPEIGMFAGMMTSSTEQLQQVNTEHHNQWTVETTGFMDQTAEIEGLFDLTGAVDQSYWNQNHWNDNDHDHHINFIS